ncbi:hypothetical protein B0H14DRAFT_2211230, partial [Mycena olivaceomarginata]
MRDISNEFLTRQPDGLAFSSVVKIARNEGHTRSQLCAQEPPPAGDLNGADVARKLTIVSLTVS